MSSAAPRMASPRKRSRAERDDEDEEMTRAEGNGGGVPVGGGGDGLFTFPVKSTSSNSDMTLPDSSDDDDIGPAMPSISAPKKKRRVLPYEKLYISALPSSQRYSKSLMHKEQLSFVTMTPFTDFLITSSIDGVVKFWKKVAVGIEAVKEFRAHIGEIKSVTVSQDGRSFATAGVDKTIKIFDVVTFGTCATRTIYWRLRVGSFPNPQIFSSYYNWATYQGQYAGSMLEVLLSPSLQYQRKLAIQSRFTMAGEMRQTLFTRSQVFITAQ